MSNDAPSRPARTVLGRMVHVVRTEPVACQGVIQSGLAVMVGFGLLTWTAEQTGLVLGLTAAIFGVFARSQVTPKAKADATSVNAVPR
jgi:type IV secretory pathway TrbD component